MKRRLIGGVLMTLAVAGCSSPRWAFMPGCWLRAKDAPVAEVAAIDRMTGDELTEKCVFIKNDFMLPYRLHSPAKVEEKTRYPLVLFLHGAGERGNDNVKTLVHGVLPICRYAMKHGDAYVIAPQCPSGRKWVCQDWSKQSMRRPDEPSAELSAVMDLVRGFVETHPVDVSRIYVTGISMGGFGTWDIVPRMPGFFAAMMPICGGVDAATVPLFAREGDGFGIRFFHGGADAVVTPEYSRRMDRALAAAGVEHGYMEYPGVGHDCWTRTYAGEANLAWLFGCRRKSFDTRFFLVGE